MPDWLSDNQALAWWLGTLSVVMFVGSLIVVPMIVVRMRADYFVRPEPPPQTWPGRYPVLRWMVLTLKNLLGAIFIVAGMAMLALPGQGVISILIGIALLNVPGKRRLELWIVRRRGVLRTVNWMRVRAGRLPLELPPREQKEGPGGKRV
jgi:hypothetical protein